MPEHKCLLFFAPFLKPISLLPADASSDSVLLTLPQKETTRNQGLQHVDHSLYVLAPIRGQFISKPSTFARDSTSSGGYSLITGIRGVHHIFQSRYLSHHSAIFLVQ